MIRSNNRIFAGFRSMWSLCLSRISVVTVSVLLCSFWLTIIPAFAQSTHVTLEGGVANEFDYQEYVFITGKPVKLTGKLKVSVSGGAGGTATTKLTYTLADAAGESKLSRSLTYLEMSGDRADKKQTVRTSQLDKFSESITIGGTKYQLADYRLSKSVVEDKRPVIDYYSGNWEGRKVYTVNKTEGRIVVETSGTTVGYDSNWGRTETQRMLQTIVFEPSESNTSENAKRWDGRIDMVVNLSTDRVFAFATNEPTTISFSGGNVLTETGKTVIRYNYDLPANVAQTGSERSQGELLLSLDTSPKIQRLYVPEYEDTRAHWAEQDIARLAGLGAWDSQQGYFGPQLPVTRLEFARALVNATGMASPDGPQGNIAYTAGYPNLPPVGGGKATKSTVSASSATKGYNGTTGTPRGKVQPVEAPAYSDLSASVPGYQAVKTLYEKGVMQGTGVGTFGPHQYLTREQAVTIAVRALGLESLAPSGLTYNAFFDDALISPWARDAVYVGVELNLLKGDPYGNFRPDEIMSRAETATFLNRMITFLQQDIRHDFRDRLLNRR